MAARAKIGGGERTLTRWSTARARVRMVVGMSDEKPNPFDDVRRGLGLLFRAARTTVEKLPTKDLEDAVVTSAREVGRAIENVGRTIEREVFGKKVEVRRPPPSGPDSPDGVPSPGEPKSDDPKPPDAA